MTETFKFNEPTSSLNTLSQPQLKEKIFDAIEKIKENFAQNAIKCDYYKDNTGTNWIIGYVGRNEDGTEWRLWTSYKPPMDGTDAKYIATDLDESAARDLFKSIVGRTNEEITKTLEEKLTPNKVINEEGVQKAQKPRIGKPYSQQPGRKAGKGAGHIVARRDYYGNKYKMSIKDYVKMKVEEWGDTLDSIMSDLDIFRGDLEDSDGEEEKEYILNDANKLSKNSTKIINDISFLQKESDINEELLEQIDDIQENIISSQGINSVDDLEGSIDYLDEALRGLESIELEDIEKTFNFPTLVKNEDKVGFEKAKPRIGKPYSQQPGRKAGKGRGKIVGERDGKKVVIASTSHVPYEEFAKKQSKEMMEISNEDRLNNAVNFDEWLELVDSTPELELQDYFNKKGSEYIDTPGFYAEEKERYNGIQDFMNSNMGAQEFNKLKEFYEENVKIDPETTMTNKEKKQWIKDTIAAGNATKKFRGWGKEKENFASSKKPRIGKPYSQQPGRKAGKGAGKIVAKQDSAKDKKQKLTFKEYEAIERKAYKKYDAIQEAARKKYEAIEQPAREKYEAIEKPALKEYEAIRKSAWEEYKAIQQSAWKKYLVIQQSAWKKHRAIEQSASEKYKTIEQFAWEKYRAIEQPALEKYLAIKQSALEEYKAIQQSAWKKYITIKQPAEKEYKAIQQSAWNKYKAKKAEEGFEGSKNKSIKKTRIALNKAVVAKNISLIKSLRKELTSLQKAKPRMGKPYSQQPGRKAGKGAGKIVDGKFKTGFESGDKIVNQNPRYVEVVDKLNRHYIVGDNGERRQIISGGNFYPPLNKPGLKGSLGLKEIHKAQKPRIGKPYSQQSGRKTGKGAGKIVKKKFKYGIGIDKKEYEQIKSAAIDLFRRVLNRDPRINEKEEFFKNYDKAMEDLSGFYSNKPSKNDMTYPLIFSRRNDTPEFYNGSMTSKFGRTHIYKNVGGIKLHAGYLGAGSGGVGFRLPPKKWNKKQGE